MNEPILNALVEAAEACEAWHAAEAETPPKSTSYDARVDLCHWSEYLTTFALAVVRGEATPGKFVPVPRIGFGPGPEILDMSRDADECRAAVREVRALLCLPPSRVSVPKEAARHDGQTECQLDNGEGWKAICSCGFEWGNFTTEERAAKALAQHYERVPK